MKLEDVLEKFKQMGNYAVSLYYGEDIGCDDSDIPQKERTIKIVMSPVGYLGEVRVMLVTNLKELDNIDFSARPVQISNPPKYEEYKNNGFYAWGTEKAINDFLNEGFKGDAK